MISAVLEIIRKVSKNKTQIIILLHKFKILPYFEFHGSGFVTHKPRGKYWETKYKQLSI